MSLNLSSLFGIIIGEKKMSMNTSVQEASLSHLSTRVPEIKLVFLCCVLFSEMGWELFCLKGRNKQVGE